LVGFAAVVDCLRLRCIFLCLLLKNPRNFGLKVTILGL
jgi:hypothetical protein